MANTIVSFEDMVSAIKLIRRSKTGQAAAEWLDGDDGGELLRRGHTATVTSNVSIASRAKKNVCQFPLLVSSNVSVKMYNKTAALLEQLYAVYLKLTIYNMTAIINVDNNENKYTVARKVHTNDSATRGFIDDMRINQVDSNYYSSVKMENSKLFSIEKLSKNALLEAHNELMKPYLENFNLRTLDNKEILFEDSGASYDFDVTSINSELNKLFMKLHALYNASRNIVPGDKNYVRWNTELADTLEKINAYFDILTKIANKETMGEDASIAQNLLTNYGKLSIYNDIQMVKTALEDRAKAGQRSSINDEEKKTKVSANDTTSKIDSRFPSNTDIERSKTAISDVNKKVSNENKNNQRNHNRSYMDLNNVISKKNNALEPTFITIPMKYTGDDGKEFTDTSMQLAIKTVTHTLDSSELRFYINETLEKRRKVFRAIQVLTGEKEFSLKFLLHLDEAKRDAAKDTITVKWWRHLKDRRTASWIRVFRKQDPYIPNATLILTREDLDTLRLEYGKDLLNTNLAYQLTDYLFLMHVIIIDDNLEEIYIFDKADRIWNAYSTQDLFKEIKMLDKAVTK